MHVAADAADLAVRGVVALLLVGWCLIEVVVAGWLVRAIEQGRVFTPPERVRVLALVFGLAPIGPILSRLL